MTTATQLRDQGWDAVQAADAAINRLFRTYLESALVDCIEAGEPFSADDIRAQAKKRAELDDRLFDPAPNLLPSVIGRAAQAGVIVRTGTVNARRKTRHASRNGVYVSAHCAPEADCG